MRSTWAAWLGIGCPDPDLTVCLWDCWWTQDLVFWMSKTCKTWVFSLRSNSEQVYHLDGTSRGIQWWTALQVHSNTFTGKWAWWTVISLKTRIRFVLYWTFPFGRAPPAQGARRTLMRNISRLPSSLHPVLHLCSHPEVTVIFITRC